MISPLLKLVRQLTFISPFLFVAYLFRFQVAGIPFSIAEIFVYLLFGLWTYELIRDHKIVTWDKATRRYWYAAFFILVGATLGVLMAPEFMDLPSGEILNTKRMTLGIWKGWVLAPILYFAVLTQVLKKKEDVEELLRMFVYSAVVVSLLAHFFGIFSEGVTIDLRLRGFYESANYLSLYLVPAVLINAYFIFLRNKLSIFQKRADIATLTILTYSLFFTQSYAAIIAVFGSLGLFALYYLLQHPRQRKKIITALLVLFFTFVAALLTQLNTPKFKQFLDFENRSSTTVRLEIYQTSAHLIRTKPIFGVGPGLFQVHYQNAAPEVLGRAPLEWNMPHSHNIFLGFWINAGIIGLLAFLTLIAFCHWRFTYPLIALWGILLHGLFDMPFWKNDLSMIFWLIIACILILQKTGSKKT